ncbi:MAG: hypothetical protein LBS46_09570 [Dysgonamonadaceae bacterium]|jgi:hypothetical protein|nr:hypothetical protein [Dysgonamonadaceae bacterium]
MDTVKRMMLTMGFLLACFSAGAQTNLNIGAIFDEYGKQKGSILIELGKDVLGNHTNIKRYKSLIMPSDTATLRMTEEAMARDIKDGRKLLESRKDGTLESASYCLTKDKKSPEYEYLLFSNQSNRMTLIYVKGNFAPNRLEDELYKLKNLFIKINNKQIKL